jgi:hypothetical protein
VTPKSPNSVVPAQAGTQGFQSLALGHRQGHAATLLAVVRERNPPNNSIMRQASMLPMRALNHEGRMIEPGGPLVRGR